MSNGFGAGFGGVMILVALVVVAGLLAVSTAVARYWRHGRGPVSVRFVAVGLVAIVLAVAGFGVAALVDEAPRIAALFVVIVWLPLVVVAGRARWVGDSWSTVAAVVGMAWSLPFLVAVGVLFVFTVATDVSTVVMTALAGIVATGGALVAGEYVRPVVIENEG